jgi:uncharacterized membrane protein
MKIYKSDLEKLNRDGIITDKQLEQIINYYQTKTVSSNLWTRLFIMSGLLISLGIILIIGANWHKIPYLLKLLVDFVLFLSIVYADYYFTVNDKKNIAEIFLTISFFMVAGSIGLIAQTYNLDGGWFSFARWWMILSIPFVSVSKNKLVNILWIVLLLNSLPDYFYTYIKDTYTFLTTKFLHFSKETNVSIVLAFIYIMLELINYCSLFAYKKLNNKILLFKSFSFIVTVLMITVAFILAVIYKNIFGIIFIFCLLAYKIYSSYQIKSFTALRNNAVLAELYIIYIFIRAYGNLLFTGTGFIVGGIMLLIFVYILKRTLKYIKLLES